MLNHIELIYLGVIAPWPGRWIWHVDLYMNQVSYKNVPWWIHISRVDVYNICRYVHLSCFFNVSHLHDFHGICFQHVPSPMWPDQTFREFAAVADDGFDSAGWEQLRGLKLMLSLPSSMHLRGLALDLLPDLLGLHDEVCLTKARWLANGIYIYIYHVYIYTMWLNLYHVYII